MFFEYVILFCKYSQHTENTLTFKYKLLCSSKEPEHHSNSEMFDI